LNSFEGWYNPGKRRKGTYTGPIRDCAARTLLYRMPSRVVVTRGDHRTHGGWSATIFVRLDGSTALLWNLRIVDDSVIICAVNEGIHQPNLHNSIRLVQISADALLWTEMRCDYTVCPIERFLSAWSEGLELGRQDISRPGSAGNGGRHGGLCNMRD
jgi:hypothetical protein